MSISVALELMNFAGPNPQHDIILFAAMQFLFLGVVFMRAGKRPTATTWSGFWSELKWAFSSDKRYPTASRPGACIRTTSPPHVSSCLAALRIAGREGRRRLYFPAAKNERGAMLDALAQGRSIIEPPACEGCALVNYTFIPAALHTR